MIINVYFFDAMKTPLPSKVSNDWLGKQSSLTKVKKTGSLSRTSNFKGIRGGWMSQTWVRVALQPTAADADPDLMLHIVEIWK